MQKLILIVILMSPLYLLAQDTQTEALMKQLGYEKVDMEKLEKKQAAQKPCSTCPMKKKSTPSYTNTVSNADNEIKKLKKQIPNLEQNIISLKNAPHAKPAMLQKYEQALANNIKRIKELESQSTPTQSTTTNH